MSCRPLLALPLLFAASGCAQVLGSVRDTTVIDLFPSTALKETCAVTLMERAGGGVALGDASLREIPQRKGHEFAGLVEVGRLRVDGPTWLVREDIEEHARHRACAAGASHALIERERYGVVAIGSGAQIRLFAPAPAPAPTAPAPTPAP